MICVAKRIFFSVFSWVLRPFLNYTQEKNPSKGSVHFCKHKSLYFSCERSIRSR